MSLNNNNYTQSRPNGINLFDANGNPPPLLSSLLLALLGNIGNVNQSQVLQQQLVAHNPANVPALQPSANNPSALLKCPVNTQLHERNGEQEIPWASTDSRPMGGGVATFNEFNLVSSSRSVREEIILRGSNVVPCRARSMPMDHNSSVSADSRLSHSSSFRIFNNVLF